MKSYKAWRVKFSYDAASNIPGRRESDVYNVLATSREHAQEKAYTAFTQTGTFEHYRFDEHPEDLRTTVTPLRSSLKLPKLTLEEDRHYQLTPQLVQEGKQWSLELIVGETQQ